MSNITLFDIPKDLLYLILDKLRIKELKKLSHVCVKLRKLSLCNRVLKKYEQQFNFPIIFSVIQKFVWASQILKFRLKLL